MSKDVPVASLNVNEKPKLSWRASVSEVVSADRNLRSSRPEVIYSLDAAERLNLRNPAVIIEQIKSPYGRGRSALTASAPDLHTLTIPGDLRPPTSQGPADNVQEVEEEEVEEQEEQEQQQEEQLLEEINVIGELDEVDEVFDSDSEMAEDKAIAPSTFTGSTAEDADAWLRHFQNYCHYKGYNEAKSLALFKVLLTGSAATWLDSQGEGVVGSLQNLTAKFNDRYKTPEILKYRSAKEIFSRRQQDNESVEDYVSYMKKLAKTIGADDKILQFAILNGLNPNISAFVVQQRPTTVDNLLEAARMAELTVPPRLTLDSTLSEQLADVQNEVKRLSLKWDRATSAPVFDRSPSPTQTRRVTFAPQQDRQTPPRFEQRPMNRGMPSRRGFGRQPGFNYWDRRQQSSFSAQAMQNDNCPKCGQRNHRNINYCPAVNRLCNFCLKKGHFSRVCRAALRSRTQMQYK